MTAAEMPADLTRVRDHSRDSDPPPDETPKPTAAWTINVPSETIDDSPAWDALFGPAPVKPLRGSARHRHVQRLMHDAKAQARAIMAEGGPPASDTLAGWAADLTYQARATRAVQVLEVVVGMVERVEQEPVTASRAQHSTWHGKQR
jgi:hypothetical protein